MSCCFQGLWACVGCGSSSGGGKTPGCGYFVDMAQLKVIAYHKLLNCRSTDGGRSASFPGPGSIAYLKHGECVELMKGLPSAYKEGTIFKGADLGFIRLNPIFWPDAPFALGIPAEKHEWIRPILDSRLGANGGQWDAQLVADSAAKFLDDEYSKNVPFTAGGDKANSIKVWGQILLHRVHLGIELSYEEAQEFCDIQAHVLVAIVLPACLTNVIGSKLGSEKFLEFRAKCLTKYKAAFANILTQSLQPEDMHLLASAMLDSLMFAGGLSVASVISCAMATIYSNNSPYSDEPPLLPLRNGCIPSLVWETVRYYPAVVGFPWYDGPDMNNRTCVSLASALRDPDVWGEDSNKFKLRDLAEQHRLSVAWADAADDPALPKFKRICPAKDLSLCMATEFLNEWAKRQNLWEISDEAREKIKITPTTPFVNSFQFQPAK